MPEMICPFCKTKWPSDFRWCMEDGSELEDNKGQYDMEIAAESSGGGVECPECGTVVDPRDEFCAGCGARLQSAETARAMSQELTCRKCGGLLTPGDEFCGGCGAPSSGEAPAAVAAAPMAAGGAGVTCPGCGMAVQPGEAFCGTCGFNMSQVAAVAPSQPAPAMPPAPMAAPAAGGGCPNCGMEVAPGEAFCGTCGFNLAQAAAPAPQTAPQPAPMAAPAPAPAAGGGCPNCGMEVAPGEAFCGTCGFNLAQAAAPAPQAAPQPAPMAAPVPVPVAGGGCPNCGMEVAPGEAFCGTCGFNLAQAAAPAPQAAPQPAPMAAPPAPAPAAGGGCPNCGMEIAPGEAFCGTCGFNLSPVSQDEPQPLVPEAPATQEITGVACPNCGMDIQPGETFCGTCGFSLLKPVAGAAPAPVQEISPGPEPMPAPAPAPSGPSCPNCGMETTPGETFCGTCGFNLTPAPKAPEPQAPIEYAEPAAPPSPGASCPNCGMENQPGETFCGTCGFNLSAAPPQPAVRMPVSVCTMCGADIFEGDASCGTCGNDADGMFAPEPPPVAPAPVAPPEPPPAAPAPAFKGLRCPECGSTETAQGGMFCAACGAMVGTEDVPPAAEGDLSAGVADPFYAPPAQEPVRSLGDFTADIPVCPNCGVEGTAGSATCKVCGASLTPQGEFFTEPLPEPEPVALEQPAFEPAPAAAPPPPPPVSFGGGDPGAPICVECGQAAGASDAVCPFCGGVLIAPEAPSSFEEPFAAPAPPPPPEKPAPDFPAFEETPTPAAAAPVEGGKICACCGNSNPADAPFCGTCGVDFD